VPIVYALSANEFAINCLLCVSYPAMESKKIHIEYRVAAHHSELSPDDARLFAQAVEAMRSAYAPYSEFSVGAAVELVNGVVVIGSNQENIAYPSGLCAERVALFAASSQYPGVPVKALAIAARHKSDLAQKGAGSVTPCGACRQVMMEYERMLAHPIRILTGAPEGEIIILDKAERLLPLVFFSAELVKGRK